MVLSIGAFFVVPTGLHLIYLTCSALGGMTLIMSGIVYIVAFIRKEQPETCSSLSAAMNQKGGRE